MLDRPCSTAKLQHRLDDKLEEFQAVGYVMIIKAGEKNFSDYSPDLPGCIATAKTVEEVKQRMSEAVAIHLHGMREDGLTIPQPISHVLGPSAHRRATRSATRRPTIGVFAGRAGDCRGVNDYDKMFFESPSA